MLTLNTSKNQGSLQEDPITEYLHTPALINAVFLVGNLNRLTAL